ncbi:hypothetical protein CNE_1c21860 [Cupriavidus necator N-1]|uniref:Uncharacterized protein n=1 Tax=Cupriavidus necator (strain ATCC 43291 / DSM 13513 / CCUG 52238 / LMG 8453 / N-1) TaxID=1042878 RepID=G0EZT6_CUPNN|nr:hypothetical protein CNE_1c21860 [Cupriavidus necator N-1]
MQRKWENRNADCNGRAPPRRGPALAIHNPSMRHAPKILLALRPILYKITAYCLNIQCLASRMQDKGSTDPLPGIPAAPHGMAIPWRP